ncbi:hypothetical protein NDK43_02555 [Neobacillus pocheonensis]|uniref:Helix-turn-helix domain-containing protein n=1 Tax=Neobacillus pocheonensis TaxID=363869 RepID=A0ABT0W616_9BACI|nr:hypothetical protein [Neobacillus pocheonensis]
METEALIPPYLANDKEMLDEVMKFSTDGESLPPANIIQEKRQTLAIEIRRRFGGYYEFAKHFGKTKGVIVNWTMEEVYQRLFAMLDTEGSLKSLSKSGTLHDKVTKDVRLAFYEECLKRKVEIPEEEIDYLVGMAKRYRYHENDTESQQKTAQKLLKEMNIDYESIPSKNRAWSAKLSDEQVRAIRSKAEKGTKLKHLAEEYNVSIDTIRRVVNRKYYSNVI